MASQSFAKLPYPVAPEAPIEPFQISVPEKEIERFHLLLDNCAIADANWENSQEDRRFGVTRDWVVEAVEEWRHNYDWRKWEQKLNSYPQYIIDVKDDDGAVYRIRFTALFSTQPKALPILFLHGWPGSVIEFVPTLDLILQQYPTADSLPYHILVPDLIGFGFSSPPPKDKDYDHEDNARILTKMMHSLGFTAENGGYMTQGGDLGGAIAPKMASLDPDNCRLTHVNVLIITPPKGINVEEDIKNGEYTGPELEALGKGMAFQANAAAYVATQGTRPATAGLAIGSSPVALLAWIGEKMLEWSDPQTTPSLEHILTNVAYYWFSGSFPTSLWIYRLVVAKGADMPPAWAGIQAPLGYSWFKQEITSPPKKWRDAVGIVKWFRAHDKASLSGGHFPALEQHEVLWGDIEDMIAELGILSKN